MARLFLAVFPPTDVIDRLDGLERPAVDGLRWTGRAQWHVTLRFLGEVESGEVKGSLRGFQGSASTVQLGPASRRLGSRVLVLPADGLGQLAAEVRARTEGIGQPPDRRGFTGHLTLARARKRIPPRLSGCHSRLSSRPPSCGWCPASCTPTEPATTGSASGH